jgi:hypothetical protein
MIHRPPEENSLIDKPVQKRKNFLHINGQITTETRSAIALCMSVNEPSRISISDSAASKYKILCGLDKKKYFRYV